MKSSPYPTRETITPVDRRCYFLGVSLFLLVVWFIETLDRVNNKIKEYFLIMNCYYYYIYDDITAFRSFPHVVSY